MHTSIVKFIPRAETEMRQVWRDLSLVLFLVPFFRQISLLTRRDVNLSCLDESCLMEKLTYFEPVLFHVSCL